jgi:hypothetical protein
MKYILLVLILPLLLVSCKKSDNSSVIGNWTVDKVVNIGGSTITDGNTKVVFNENTITVINSSSSYNHSYSIVNDNIYLTDIDASKNYAIKFELSNNNLVLHTLINGDISNDPAITAHNKSYLSK